MDHTDGEGQGATTSEGYSEGFSPSADAERSPRALTLLQWYLASVDGSDTRVGAALDKFLDFILDPTKVISNSFYILFLP